MNKSVWNWKPRKTVSNLVPQLLAGAAILILITASVTNAVIGTSQRKAIDELQLKNEEQAVEIHQQANDLSRLSVITEKGDALKAATEEYMSLYAETFTTGKTDKEIEANIGKLVEKRNQVNKAIAEYEAAKQ